MVLNTQERRAFLNCWRSFLRQRSPSKHSSIYNTGANLLSSLGRIELDGFHQVLETAGTSTAIIGHSTSRRTTHAAIPSAAKKSAICFSSSHNRTKGGKHRRLLVFQRPSQRPLHQHLHRAYGQRPTASSTQSGQASYSSIAASSSSLPLTSQRLPKMEPTATDQDKEQISSTASSSSPSSSSSSSSSSIHHQHYPHHRFRKTLAATATTSASTTGTATTGTATTSTATTGTATTGII